MSRTSHGRRCPHCLGELEPEAGLDRRGEAGVASEDDDGVIGSGEAVGPAYRAWVKRVLKPPKAKPKPRRRKRK